MGRTIKLHFISFNAKWSYVKIVVADGVIDETTLYDVQTEILRELAGDCLALIYWEWDGNDHSDLKITSNNGDISTIFQ